MGRLVRPVGLGLLGVLGLFALGVAPAIPAGAQQAAYPCAGPQGEAGSSLTPGGFCYYALPMDEFCLELMSEQDVQICLPPISDGSEPGGGVYGPTGILHELSVGLATGTLRPTSSSALETTRDRVARYLYALSKAQGMEGERLTRQVAQWEEGRALRPERRPAPMPRARSREGVPAGSGTATDPGFVALAAWLDRESRSSAPRPR